MKDIIDTLERMETATRSLLGYLKNRDDITSLSEYEKVLEQGVLAIIDCQIELKKRMFCELWENPPR